MIRFACPGCSATFTVEDEKAGKTGKCPKCQSQFVIPAAGGDGGPPVDLQPPPLPDGGGAQPPPLPSAPSPDAPVEIRPCPQCQSRLSVLPSDLGLDIECPSCRAVYKATRADAPPPPGSGRGRSGGSLVKLGSGSDNTDDDDRDRRRSRRDDRDRDDDRRSSRRRDDDEEDRPSRRRSRRDDDEDDPDRRYRRRRYDDDYDGGRRWDEPHRGTMILVFGVLGFTVCGIFAILAWTMGSQDLKAMDAGRMDPEGRGLTRAGQIMGMITCLLTIVLIVCYCGFIGIMVAAGGGR